MAFYQQKLIFLEIFDLILKIKFKFLTEKLEQFKEILWGIPLAAHAFSTPVITGFFTKNHCSKVSIP